MTLRDGENALGVGGASTAISRDKNVVVVAIACGNEQEAISVIDRMMHDIRQASTATIRAI